MIIDALCWLAALAAIGAASIAGTILLEARGHDRVTIIVLRADGTRVTETIVDPTHLQIVSVAGRLLDHRESLQPDAIA
jgi:hypothetical protein